jgi:hypothetical protein
MLGPVAAVAVKVTPEKAAIASRDNNLFMVTPKIVEN